MTFLSLMRLRPLLFLGSLISTIGLLGACAGSAVPVIPTALPTITATYTPSPTRTPARDVTPTQRPTQVAAQATGGPSPTPLLGATRTALPEDFVPTPTRNLNPNAPRLEFFTSDPLAVEPGESVTLFWSARNVDGAVIYRVEDGERTQVYNVPPDGNLVIDTRRSERGSLNFVVRVGDENSADELSLTIPLQCPISWFFAPAPSACAEDEALETQIIDQSFERGRMLYVRESDTIYVLFNDGQTPAWRTFASEYDPEIHPERDENAPPNFIQPLRELGYLWRTNDVVRTRLGLGTAEAVTFEGFAQTSEGGNNRTNIYISSAGRSVLHLIPGGDVWEIIAPQGG
jgi:hypothetical protein